MILIQTPRRGCSRNKQMVTDDERMVRLQINVGEYEWDNQERTIQGNWQHRVHKTTNNTTKRQHNTGMRWTPLDASKHK